VIWHKSRRPAAAVAYPEVRGEIVALEDRKGADMFPGARRPPNNARHTNDSKAPATVPWYKNQTVAIPAIVAIVVALVAAGVAIYTNSHPASPAPSPPPLTVTVDPESAAADEDVHINVSGAGFTADRKVKVEVANFAEDADVTEGSFVTGFTVPAGGLEPHTYIVLVTGLDSGRKMQGGLTMY
jgi:hypothetical protein